VHEHEILKLLQEGRAVRKVIHRFETQFSVQAMQKVIKVVQSWLCGQRPGAVRSRGESSVQSYQRKVEAEREFVVAQQREAQLVRQGRSAAGQQLEQGNEGQGDVGQVDSDETSHKAAPQSAQAQVKLSDLCVHAGSGTEFLAVLMLPRAASEPGHGLRFWS